MKYTHIFTLSNGETSCRLISAELKKADFVKNSQQVAIKDFGDAKNLKFCSLPRGWDGGWHNSPVKQFVIGVSGAIQITCSDNSKVIIGEGDVVLLEDLTGKGHHTEVTSNQTWNGVLVEI